MQLRDTSQYQQLREAMELISELKVPEHLQQKALEHLLRDAPGEGNQLTASPADNPQHSVPIGSSNIKVLREFMNIVPKRAVAEIPALVFWTKEYEKKDTVNEQDILELYHRAGVRPPKNIAQSLRDLASKKYKRLEAVRGMPGCVRLSRSGESFVQYDLIQKAEKS